MQEKSFLDYFYVRLDKLKMATPLVAIENESLRKSIGIMKENRVGSLLIINTEEKLSGIITERDILLKVAGEDVDLDKPVSEFMTRSPKYLSTFDTIYEVIEVMDHGHFRHLPIVDDEGLPIGIISIKDVVDYICAIRKDFLSIE